MLEPLTMQQAIKKEFIGYLCEMGYIRNLFRLADKCSNSPIESLLFWEFVKMLGYESYNNGGIIFGFTTTNGMDFFGEILPQHPIQVGSNNIFVDFFIDIYQDDSNREKQMADLCIECDGHGFHEKTKEQVQRDKARDRILVAKGYRVIHYTGSEIWANPTKIVEEIEDILIHTFDHETAQATN